MYPKNIPSHDAGTVHDVLWPAGLVVVVIMVAWAIGNRIGLAHPQYAAYLLGGLLPPILLIAGSQLSRHRPHVIPSYSYCQYASILVLTVVALRYAARFTTFSVLATVAIQVGLTAILELRDRTKFTVFGDWGRNRICWASVAMLLAVCCWDATLKVPWWLKWPLPYSLQHRTYAYNVLVYSPYSYAVLAVITLLWAYQSYWKCQFVLSSPWRKRLFGLELLMVTFLFSWVSLKPFMTDIESYFSKGAFHHWGVYIGPAQMVRDGGYLLWDVPSQYGFLSELILAALPFKSIWMALYVTNALLQTLSALILYILLRTIRPGIVSAIFSAVIAVVTVFMMQGIHISLVGSQCWPSAGAYRFFWAEALLALVYLEYRMDSPLKWAPLVYVAGSFVWLVGVLWASESAVYCSTIWLPALALMLYRHSRAHRPRSESSVLAGRAIWAAQPFLLLLVAVAVIEAIFFRRLGHGPDWRAYIDYAIACQNGHAEQPLTLDGCVWLPLSIFAGLAVVTWRALKAGIGGRSICLLSAAWTFLWSTTSYFLSNSHPNVLQGQIALYAMVIAIAVHVSARIGLTSPAKSLLAICWAPIFIMAPTITIGRGDVIQDWMAQTFRPPLTNVDSTLPTMPLPMERLLDIAHVRANDPLVVLEQNEAPVRRPNNPMHMQGTNPRWLPIEPFSLVAPLSDDRIEVYVRRYLERNKSGGWLVEPINGVRLSDMCVYRIIQRYCRPTRSYLYRDLMLTYFQYVGRR